MKKIIALKLRTGEEVLGELLDHADWPEKIKTIPKDFEGLKVLRRPVVPGEVVQQGQRMMHLFRWPQLSKDEEFVFFSEDYMGIPYDVTKELEDAYVQITSGIALA
jgi:hypothetical protein